MIFFSTFEAAAQELPRQTCVNAMNVMALRFDPPKRIPYKMMVSPHYIRSKRNQVQRCIFFVYPPFCARKVTEITHVFSRVCVCGFGKETRSPMLNTIHSTKQVGFCVETVPFSRMFLSNTGEEWNFLAFFDGWRPLGDMSFHVILCFLFLFFFCSLVFPPCFLMQHRLCALAARTTSLHSVSFRMFAWRVYSMRRAIFPPLEIRGCSLIEVHASDWSPLIPCPDFKTGLFCSIYFSEQISKSFSGCPSLPLRIYKL